MKILKFYLITALISLVPVIAAEPPARKPNILFIYLDDFGWKDAGFMGSDFYETPNLDALAAKGMVFTDAYFCAANCAPARGSLLSGQYSPRHRIFNVGTKPRGEAAMRRLKVEPGTSVLDESAEKARRQSTMKRPAAENRGKSPTRKQ